MISRDPLKPRSVERQSIPVMSTDRLLTASFSYTIVVFSSTSSSFLLHLLLLGGGGGAHLYTSTTFTEKNLYPFYLPMSLSPGGREVPQSSPEVPRAHLGLHHGLVSAMAQGRPGCRLGSLYLELRHCVYTTGQAGSSEDHGDISGTVKPGN